jgi:hypothetical protein
VRFVIELYLLPSQSEIAVFYIHMHHRGVHQKSIHFYTSFITLSENSSLNLSFLQQQNAFKILLLKMFDIYRPSKGLNENQAKFVVLFSLLFKFSTHCSNRECVRL